MTRFAWLQSRTQALAAAALLAALAVVAAITGIQMSHLFHASVAHCTTGCGLAISQFLAHDTFLDRGLDIVARAVPALLGVFWGAPLVARELETGTYRLAWTQSVSRSRWVVTRLAVVGLATVAVAGLLTLTVTWWYTSRDQVGGSDPYQVFDRRNVAPIGYAAFAFASGALLGVVIRRVVPAMATTLGLFVVVRAGVSLWVRPHLMTPVQSTMALFGAGATSRVNVGIGSSGGGPVQLFVQGDGPPRSWTLSSHLVTSSGHRPGSAELAAFVHQNCPNVGAPSPAPAGHSVAAVPDADAARACLQQVATSFKLVVTYQPANRYWTFQWLELGLYVVLAIVAAITCYWWVTRRTD